MDIKTISVALVAVMVGAVMFGALIPIFDDVTATEDTFTNEGIWRMEEIENGDSWTLSAGTWTTTDNKTLSPISANNGSNVILGDEWCVRAVGQPRGHTIGGNPNNTVAIASDSNVIITGSGIIGTTTQSLSGYGFDPEGNYVMTAYNDQSYMNGDSIIYATGSSLIDGVYVIVHIDGTIDDDVSITIDSSYSNTGTPVLSDLVITNKKVNYTEVNGYVDLYKLESITFDASFNLTINETTTAYSGPVTYSSYVVPYEVTAERSVHVTDSMGVIMDLIPLIIGLGLVLVTIAYFIRKQ